MSKRSNHAAYDAMVAELNGRGLADLDAGYAIDMVMATYKRFNVVSAKRIPQTGQEIYAEVEDDLTARGLQRLIDPVVCALKNYVVAMDRDD